MKLEIKHLAPYLPYSLEILQPSAEHRNRFTLDIEGLRIMECQGFEYFKPILKPLSKLSNEELVPIGLFIRDIEKNKATYKDNIFAIEDAKAWIRTGMKPVLSLLQVQSIMEHLYSVHADFFKLIDAGLAVDINTITP